MKMLTETSQSFISHVMAFEEAPDVADAIRRGGRLGIDLALRKFVEKFSLECHTPQCAASMANIEANWEEAIQCAAGVLGMM